VTNGAADVNGTATPSLLESPNANQHSRVNALILTFNQPVTFGAGAFSLALRPFTKNGVAGSAQGDITTGITPTSYDGGFTYVLTFSGGTTEPVTGGSIGDGDYTITLNHTLVTGGGGLAADFTSNFYRLFGDINGTGAVNNPAFVKFKAAFGSSTSTA